MPVDSWYISSFTTYLQRWKPTVTVIFPSWMMIYEFELRQLREGYRLSLTLPSVCFDLPTISLHRPLSAASWSSSQDKRSATRHESSPKPRRWRWKATWTRNVARAMGKKGWNQTARWIQNLATITDLHVNLVISTSLSGSFPQGVRLKIHWNHQ